MKLKYILPVATIASVATAVAPIAVSCGNSTSLTLDYYAVEGITSGEGGVLRTKDPINVVANKKYNLTVDYSLYANPVPIQNKYAPFIAIGTRIEDPSHESEMALMNDLLELHASSIIVDGVELKDGGDVIDPTDTPEFKPNYFYYLQATLKGLDIKMIIFNYEIQQDSKLSATITSPVNDSKKYIFAGFQKMN